MKHGASEDLSDQLEKEMILEYYTFLGNCPLTPPRNPTLTLTSQFVQNVALGEG